MTDESSLRGSFRNRFPGDRQIEVAVAPGRVNLIGEHTDYNDGWVLPMAIDLTVQAAFAPNQLPQLRLYSCAFDESCEVSLENPAHSKESEWGAYVAGVAWAMLEAGLPVVGVDLAIDGDVPLGSGLSSSAALQMAIARALCHSARVSWDPVEMAVLARRAENEFVGVASGVMDHFASACGEQDQALLLDCRSLEYETVSVPSELRFVVLDTGIRRSLSGSEFNLRKARCDQAVEQLRRLEPGVEALRDVDMNLLRNARPELSEVQYSCARHVIEENARPRAMAAALRADRPEAAGALMNDSHASLRDLYGVSSRELDYMTELARQHPACFGARLTGAGFGGCAVALVRAELAESFLHDVHASYTAKFDVDSEFFVCRAQRGAQLSRSDEKVEPVDPSVMKVDREPVDRGVGP